MDDTMILLEPFSYHQVSGAPMIFLAGPIHGDPVWQSAAFDIIRATAGDMVVASPRRLHSVEHYRFKQTDTLRSFREQNQWEHFMMETAGRQGCVLFWLPGPADAPHGAVYRATTSIALRTWISRYSGNPDAGLCIGTDGAFPGIDTITRELALGMPRHTLHRTLEATVREAISIAHATFDAWVATGSPPMETECELEVRSHDHHSLAKQSARLSGNPMNDPEAIRRKMLAMLREADGWRTMKQIEVETPLSMETDELTELEDLSDDPDVYAAHSLRSSARDAMVAEMRATGTWYLAGQRVGGPKYLAIGRSTYYVPFLQRLAVELGAPVYQSDFMEWIDPAHPEISLMYYLKTAERIDVNLEGINPADLRAATVDAGRCAVDRGDLQIPYVTSWEMNQLYWDKPAIPVFWHTGGAMAFGEAYDVLGRRVPKEQICED